MTGAIKPLRIRFKTMQLLSLPLRFFVPTLCALTVGAAVHARETITFAAPTQLTATYTNGNVELHWKNNATAPGGAWIEFTTPGDDYTKLEAAWPNVNAYLHPDVAPESKLIYRIHPFYGQPSAETTITTGKAPADAKNNDEEGPLPPLEHETAVEQKPIHDLATFAAAAPDGLTGKLFSPTTVDLRWNDRATGEDGYLVEIAGPEDKDFKICALLPANATSFRKTQLAAETKCRFRVRAFFYGDSSNLATVTTGPMLPFPRNGAKVGIQ
jgi:hypothetical protein